MLDTCTERLGLATELVCSVPRRAGYNLDFFRFRAQPAIMHDQIHFAFDEQGRVVALWMWALLAPDVEQRIIADPRAIIHESEWNEGSSLWVLDLIAPYGHAPDVVRYIRRSFFTAFERINYARIRSGARVIVKRRDLASVRPQATERAVGVRRFTLPDHSFCASRSEWLSRCCRDSNSAPQRWLEERRCTST